jgi:hypothetical protein
MRSVLRWLTLGRLMVLIAFIGILIMAARPPLDTDTYWHLRAGEWQVQHRALLDVDQFSHTRTGAEWVNAYWLAQVIMFGLYAALGDAGLALFTGILALGGMAFVYRQLEGDNLLRSAVLILAALTASIFWSARPQMFSFFLSCVVLYLLWLYQKRGVDRLWLIPPIFVVWGNLHPGFAIGFILLVLAMIGEGARWLVDGIINPVEPVERPTLRPVFRIAVIGLISAVAVSINPYGPKLLLHPFRTVGINTLQTYIEEWSSPNFHQPKAWPFLWMVLGLFAAAGLSRRRLDWRDAIMTSGTAYSGFLAWRNVPTFAVAAAPVLSEHLHAWLTEIGYRLDWNRAPRNAMLAAANWLLLIAVIGGAVFQLRTVLDADHIEATRRAIYPAAAVDFMQREHVPTPVYNASNWGGFLMWQARDYPVYVDGRTDLYDDAFLNEYVRAFQGRPGWEDVLDSGGINTVLITPISPLAQLLDQDEGWEKVYGDEVAVIYVRRAP